MMNNRLLKTLVACFSLLTFNAIAIDDSALSVQKDIQANAVQQQLVNINQADKKSLLSLKGVGKKKAQAIISYRQEHGDFTNINDLLKVKGIGKHVVEDNITRLKI